MPPTCRVPEDSVWKPNLVGAAPGCTLGSMQSSTRSNSRQPPRKQLASLQGKTMRCPVSSGCVCYGCQLLLLAAEKSSAGLLCQLTRAKTCTVSRAVACVVDAPCSETIKVAKLQTPTCPQRMLRASRWAVCACGSWGSGLLEPGSSNPRWCSSATHPCCTPACTC